MAETMQGQRKWGYQTLHWWRADEDGRTQSFWSAHMRAGEKTSLHVHPYCMSVITCLYGIVRVFRGEFPPVVMSLYPGESTVITPGESHRIENGSTAIQCGFSEVYTGMHIRNEPATTRIGE